MVSMRLGVPFNFLRIARTCTSMLRSITTALRQVRLSGFRAAHSEVRNDFASLDENTFGSLHDFRLHTRCLREDFANVGEWPCDVPGEKESESKRDERIHSGADEHSVAQFALPCGE